MVVGRELVEGGVVEFQRFSESISTYSRRLTWFEHDRRSFDIVVAIGLLGLATAIMLPVRHHLNLLNLGLIYLILVIAISLIARRWVSASAAAVAFVLFDVFLILPYYTLVVARTDHLLALSVFLGVAVVISQLVYLVRRRTVEAIRHGRQMEMLYGLSQALIADVDLDSMLAGIVDRVVLVFGIQSCAVVTLDDSGQPVVRASRGVPPDLTQRDEEALLNEAAAAGSLRIIANHRTSATRVSTC